MRISFDSPVIIVFSFLSVGIYLLTSVFGVSIDLFLLSPVWEVSDPLWYFKLCSYTLGHSSLEHLITNLALILLLGPMVESKYGSKKLLLMIVSTAIITALIHLVFFNYRLLGASGIVFMLIILVSMQNIRGKILPLTFILVVIIFIGGEIVAGFKEDNVSHSAHIIGGITGAVFGFLSSGKKGTLSGKKGNNTIL